MAERETLLRRLDELGLRNKRDVLNREKPNKLFAILDDEQIISGRNVKGRALHLERLTDVCVYSVCLHKKSKRSK